jgi:adenylyltransferase/sulfurtransferase
MGLNDGDSVYVLPAVAGGSEISNDDIQRYSRQIMLEEIGFIGMQKIKKAKVCVVGVGGIGNPVLTQLVGIGIGKIRIVDRDVIEISNLHRQHLYNESDVGRVKVEVAAEKLRKMNPNVEIESVPVSVTSYNANEIVDGVDIVIDALDSIDARYALNDACIKHDIPLIYAGALGMLGSVCTIIPRKTACLRCMFPALREDDMPTCSTEGVHPSILYTVSSIQVSEAIKMIMGHPVALANKLLYVDLNELSFEKITMSRYEECPSCGLYKPEQSTESEKNIEGGLIIEELCGRDRGKRAYTITPQELKSSLDLSKIVKNAETLGYNVKIRGNLGITAINENRLSVSFLTSGSATIVGAKDEGEARNIYQIFTK